jgi:hypothetical protein
VTGDLLGASWRAVARPTLLLPAGAAALLTLLTAPILSGGNVDQVRVGVATLLAAALAATAEDPAGEVAAAAPRPRWVRCGARLLLGLVVAVPVAIASLILVAHRLDVAPTGGLLLQTLALLLIGPAVGFGVWAWGDTAQPAYAAMAGVLCIALALWVLPAGWSVIAVQPWGPPWQAALIRWAALLALTAAIVASAWRDPVDRR